MCGEKDHKIRMLPVAEQVKHRQEKESSTKYKGYKVEGPRIKLFTDVIGKSD